MTDATIQTIVIGLPLTIGAIVQAVVSLAGLRQSRQAAVSSAVGVRQNTDLAKQADAIIAKTGEIKVATDGTNSSLTAALAVANERIAGLETLVASIAKRNGIH